MDVIESKKKLIKSIDILGRETHVSKQNLIIYFYDDGTVKKQIVLQ